MKTPDDTNCIPRNKETYISVSKKIPIKYTDKRGVTKEKHIEIRFLDSLKFLPKGLDGLVSILPKENIDNLSKYFDGK